MSEPTRNRSLDRSRTSASHQLIRTYRHAFLCSSFFVDAEGNSLNGRSSFIPARLLLVRPFVLIVSSFDRFEVQITVRWRQGRQSAPGATCGAAWFSGRRGDWRSGRKRRSIKVPMQQTAVWLKYLWGWEWAPHFILHLGSDEQGNIPHHTTILLGCPAWRSDMVVLARQDTRWSRYTVYRMYCGDF